MSKPKVVLIAGAAHGGTTILSMMLGQHPDIFATGKLREFPHGVVFGSANICSCGTPAADCPFWLEIRRQYQPVEERPDDEKLPRLYELISSLSGRPFIGDVTHNVGYAKLLQSIDGIDLYLVHVVRDGRAVVYSRIRKDLRIGSAGNVPLAADTSDHRGFASLGAAAQAVFTNGGTTRRKGRACQLRGYLQQPACGVASCG